MSTIIVIFNIIHIVITTVLLGTDNIVLIHSVNIVWVYIYSCYSNVAMDVIYFVTTIQIVRSLINVDFVLNESVVHL